MPRQKESRDTEGVLQLHMKDIGQGAIGIMAVPTGDRETILKAIEAWPREDQVALAQAILKRSTSIPPSRDAMAPQRPTWREMVGLASNGQTPPSDEEVARWLDEHRSEKYG